MPMREAVSGQDDDLRSTERSLLGTLAGVLSAVPDYLFAWLVEPDEEAVPLFESRRLSQTIGRSVPLGPLDLLRASVDAAESDRLEVLIRAMTDGSDEVSGDLLVVRDDGETHQVTLTGVCTPEPDGGVRVEGVIRDLGPPGAIREQLEAALEEASHAYDVRVATQQVLEDRNRQLAELSATDHLTGAKNRRHFMQTLRDELERTDRIDSPAALLIDVDRFKSVNDTYGHLAGDAVLIAVADRLRAAIREGDTVARYGGEEFAVLLPEIPDDETLEWRAEAIRRSISVTPVLLPGGTELTVTASCGAAVWTPGETDEALLDAADRGLYAAKRGGRDATRLVSSLTFDELAADEPEVFQLARGLALAVTVREASPELHCEEVATLAGRIAVELGLSEGVALRCRLGGWLHDIGKLAIADRVLQAPAGSEEARAVLRTHVELGADIVSRLAALGGAAGAVRHHHERYDGTGYPDRLAGDDIPIDARIVAAADAWSALRHGRPYQAALDPAGALEQLRASAGLSLDPAVVAALAVVVTAQPDLTSARPGRPTRVERRSEAA
jgi:diguanylate cyclase (GGDEF)-like protein/putative nucleotidyltransferase with HDIG domain